MEREDNVRKTDQFITKVIELWPVWALLATGTVTGINFYNKVNDLVNDQRAWKGTTEQRRAESQKDIESLRTRIAVLETDVGWLKRSMK